MHRNSTARTFKALAESDLQEVYELSKEEVLREHAFRIELEKANSIENLEAVLSTKRLGDKWWTELELLEISNRFRLFGCPEAEIRLYEECCDEFFQNIPRAREFYVLALNKVDRTSDALEECRRIIAGGGGNSLLWGAMGDAYSIQMISAENLIQALDKAHGDIEETDTECRAKFKKHFPGIDIKAVSRDELISLRKAALENAVQSYRQGFYNYGGSFPGLGWMMRTIEKRIDLIAEKAYLLQCQNSEINTEKLLPIIMRTEEQIKKLEEEIRAQQILVEIALEIEGGSESLDYWNHAGKLQLALSHFGDVTDITIEEIKPIFARLFASLDAEFKIVNTMDRLRRIRDQYLRELEIEQNQAVETEELERSLETMNIVINELKGGKERFIAGGRTKGKALNKEYQAIMKGGSNNPELIFLKKTINFRTLNDSLVPQYIPGGIGRTASRVPDLTINRHVQEDIHDIVEDKIVKGIKQGEQRQPRVVIRLIQKYVGESLGVDDLQDLQSPAHHEFNIRSDGLIALSGIDRDMRKGTRSITDLTACLIMRTGDCRETMYLNGALYAHYQKIQVIEKMRAALSCLDQGDREGFRRVTLGEIPELTRYQLRGGHVSIYVESISMKEKYLTDRLSREDPTPRQRRYGLEEYRSGCPLTRYELENAKILVTYEDKDTAMVEPKDPLSGKWRPLEHIPLGKTGGIPVIPNAGDDGRNIASIQLLNLVEEHSMSFLYDEVTGEVELCDGFYNETLFDSPYCFGSGKCDTGDLVNNYGLMFAGTRETICPEGKKYAHPVFIEFLPHSETDYEFSLGEGDIPGSFRLMGRRFKGRLSEERRRLEEGDTCVPVCLNRVCSWERQQREAAEQTGFIEKKLTKVMIDLARDHPELVELQEAHSYENLITQGHEIDSIYLILSGCLNVYKDGRPLKKAGTPVKVKAGDIVGEISALKGIPPTATVSGDAVVLRISKQEFHRQLEVNSQFHEGIEELANARILEQLSDL